MGFLILLTEMLCMFCSPILLRSNVSLAVSKFASRPHSLKLVVLQIPSAMPRHSSTYILVMQLLSRHYLAAVLRASNLGIEGISARSTPIDDVALAVVVPTQKSASYSYIDTLSHHRTGTQWTYLNTTQTPQYWLVQLPY